MGLPHTFPETNRNYDSKITLSGVNVAKFTNWIETNKSFIEQYPKNYIVKYHTNLLKKWIDIQNSYIKIKEYDIFRFNQSKTDNILDYNNKRICFYLWQIKIMQNEVKEYCYDK